MDQTPLRAVPADAAFGSSIANKTPSKSKNSSSSSYASMANGYRPQPAAPAAAAPGMNDYSSYIKPATPNAWYQAQHHRQQPQHHAGSSFHSQTHRPPSQPQGPLRPWPLGTSSYNARPTGYLPPPIPKSAMTEGEGEVFDLRSAQITAEDMERHHGDAEKHMRELLSGAIGEDEGIEEGSDIVEGFKENVRLMPHQVRGVQWMKKRESARNTGGILADVSAVVLVLSEERLMAQDMGLGKSVQVLARVVEGPATAAQKKAGHTATL